MALLKLGEKKILFWQLWQCHCWKCKNNNNNNNNNNCFGNCGNGIAENVKKKKKNVLAIVAMPLPKMEKRNYEICEWVKKKSCHVYNIFTINHTWLIIISSKNLWQINCGNGIAENVKKKKIVLAIVAMALPKM